LRDISRYIAKTSPITARRFCRRMLEHIETLPDFPEKGRIVPEHRRPALRELIFPPYRIAYEIRSADRIEIMTIWHSARGTMEI
jgi:plasmid stabilization system protein ParE